ncbi:MAG: ShlB/FhaC/HecB family hemolysin secretion/activation protein, partial [Selenomonas sp.]|nr:ShlB/FhaC/HecB family hemolysin secretion/activation protein [Selenomonas sp.]
MFAIRERKLTAMLLAVLCISGGSAAMAAPPPIRDDAGLEMRRQREEAERERLRQQMEEDRKKQDEKVQGNTEMPASTGEAEVKFVLNKVTIDESAIIKTDSFNEITEPYLGKEVSLADLSNIVEKINAIYAAEGYATCKAYLPQQTIENGHVHIALIEGKTGEVSISGNKHTKESYIRNRLPLRSGTVQNFNELNKKLFRFNATNDARLGITVKAGKVPGTTDYEIVLQEPKNDVFTLSVDNSGGSNNGEWREGFYYTNRSLSGRRDSLSASYTRAKGLNSVGFNYATPVGR